MSLRTHTIDPNQPIVIRTYPNAYEAELGRIALEAAGLPCLVLGETYAEVTPSRVGLAVRRADVDAARAALEADAAVESGPGSDGEDSPTDT